MKDLKVKKMKKTIKMIGMACLVGAFAFAGSSCKKEKTDTTSIKVSTPQVEVNNIDDGDRAYIDFLGDSEMLMRWSKDDTIAFYNLNEEYTRSIRNPYKLVSGANQPEAYFSGDVLGELNEGFDGYYGFYPYSKVKNHAIGPRNSQTFDVTATQNYVQDCMDPTTLVMAVKDDDIFDGFHMDHIFGFINLKLKGTKAVERIVVTDNEFPLNGYVTVDLPKVTYGQARLLRNSCDELADYQTTYSTAIERLNDVLSEEHGVNYYGQQGYNGANPYEMTLECGGVQLSSEYTNFIMTLRPGALHQGFYVTVYYTDDTSETFNKYNYGHPGYLLGNYPAYPRGFCVKPATLNNFKLN